MAELTFFGAAKATVTTAIANNAVINNLFIIGVLVFVFLYLFRLQVKSIVIAIGIQLNCDERYW